jgi:hypothetical protein
MRPLKRYQVEVTVVQGCVHGLQYLWQAAYAARILRTPRHARAGGRGAAFAGLQGRAQEVAIGLRRAATRKQLRQGQRQPVDQAADYLASHQQRLRYDPALVQGLPIATGVIEGACRHLVKDRMDITGARWGLERAEAILKLRSLKVSGDLPAYLTFHFEQERKRHYPGPPLPPLQRSAA